MNTEVPTTGGADMSKTTSLITKAIVIPFKTGTPSPLAFSLDAGALVCNWFLKRETSAINGHVEFTPLSNTAH